MKYKFPSSQKDPELVVLKGDKKLRDQVEKIANYYDWSEWNVWDVGNLGPTLPRHPNCQNPELELNNVILRKESFGGIIYHGDLIIALNKPAYSILLKISRGKIGLEEIPPNFLKKLERYELVRQV